jgi:hypothetical protein
MASLCVLTIWSPICRGLRIVSSGARAEAVPNWNTANHFRRAPIGIGARFAAGPLPHHRAYGSVPRRFGYLSRVLPLGRAFGEWVASDE